MALTVSRKSNGINAFSNLLKDFQIAVIVATIMHSLEPGQWFSHLHLPDKLTADHAKSVIAAAKKLAKDSFPANIFGRRYKIWSFRKKQQSTAT